MKSSTARPFAEIQRIDRAEHVRSELERAIRRGDYSPGDRLPSERELGEMFGVSRVSVREAVSALKAIGLVDVQQGRGCFVARPDADQYATSFGRWLEAHHDEVMELMAVRGALDELAAGAAAENASARDLKAIETAHRAFDAAAADGSVEVDALEQLDIAFHESLVAAAKNALLEGLLHDLNRHLSTSRRAALSHRARRARAASEHLRILEAVRAGRADQARARARKHIEGATRVLEELARAT
jgi:GntR family transcriptional regulator, transcriptional repressor for pyruvate dehydrogenase complex